MKHTEASPSEWGCWRAKWMVSCPQGQGSSRREAKFARFSNVFKIFKVSQIYLDHLGSSKKGGYIARPFVEFANFSLGIRAMGDSVGEGTEQTPEHEQEASYGQLSWRMRATPGLPENKHAQTSDLSSDTSFFFTTETPSFSEHDALFHRVSACQFLILQECGMDLSAERCAGHEVQFKCVQPPTLNCRAGRTWQSVDHLGPWFPRVCWWDVWQAAAMRATCRVLLIGTGHQPHTPHESRV